MSQFATANCAANPIDQHLVSAPKSDWAWEFLRRNPHYRRAAAESKSQMVKVCTVGCAIPVFRLQEQEEAAREWALCSFRRSSRPGQHRLHFLERRSPPLLGARACPACTH
jgi:Family of unknown function (DUF6499)